MAVRSSKRAAAGSPGSNIAMTCRPISCDTYLRRSPKNENTSAFQLGPEELFCSRRRSRRKPLAARRALVFGKRPRGDRTKGCPFAAVFPIYSYFAKHVQRTRPDSSSNPVARFHGRRAAERRVEIYVSLEQVKDVGLRGRGKQVGQILAHAGRLGSGQAKLFQKARVGSPSHPCHIACDQPVN